MHMIRHIFAALILVLAGFTSSAHAASGEWAVTDHTRLRLISQTDGVGDGTSVVLGLHFQMNDHWKIYWRSPGDAGFPPSFELDGSTNAQGATIHWPLPERFSVLGFETLGYTDEVVLPITLALKQPGDPLFVTLEVSYLACAEICIPYDSVLTLALPASAATPSDETHLLNRFQTQVPGAGPSQGLSLERVEFKADGPKADTGVLYVTTSSTSAFQAPDAFIEGPDILAFAKPSVGISSDGKLAVLEIAFEGLSALETPFDQSTLTITLSDTGRSAEFNGAQPSPASADTLALADDLPSAMPAGPSMFVMLGLALMGGMILNLMPCVLPVLSIKLLSVVGHGGSSPRTVRISFLASAAGIITSFLVLAGILIALKSAGLSIGWGIQFQHPWFLVAMAMVVTLFACNLWGFFEVHLPEGVAEFGAKEVHVHGVGGHFLTGAFATLLATPCSAPFLGTAVGFALARGTGEILAIFAALGVGLALPYLLVASVPTLATRMPKPGRWMVILRRILGFALAATGLWLVSIVAAQVSDVAAGLIAAIMATVAIMLYVHKRMHRRFGKLDWVAVALLSALAFTVPDALRDVGGNAIAQAETDGLWKPFDQRAIETLVAGGNVVVIDVTADWCITCQVNKAAVLNRGPVLARLKSDDIIPMKADWTRPNEAISRYLASFGRYGIPFNAVYGPGAPDGILLPELLTNSAVLNAIDKAAQSHP